LIFVLIESRIATVLGFVEQCACEWWKRASYTPGVPGRR
jgi:hypothetical protein